MIPTKRNRKVQVPVDGFIYALRNEIERGTRLLKNARRVATRYDKTASRPSEEALDHQPPADAR